jgi:hypothetical protein
MDKMVSVRIKATKLVPGTLIEPNEGYSFDRSEFYDRRLKTEESMAIEPVWLGHGYKPKVVVDSPLKFVERRRITFHLGDQCYPPDTRYVFETASGNLVDLRSDHISQNCRFVAHALAETCPCCGQPLPQ